jgi:hypothetical protein
LGEFVAGVYCGAVAGAGVLRAGAEGVKKGAGWTEDEIEASEPLEALDRRPAVYYAPRGECEYCDRRRAAAARSMRAVREREG